MLHKTHKSGAPSDIRDALQLVTNDKPVESDKTAAPKSPRTRLVRRINLELPEKAADQLEWLEQETGSASSAEVIRDALKLYYGLVQEVKKGGSITLTESSGEVKDLKIFL